MQRSAQKRTREERGHLCLLGVHVHCLTKQRPHQPTKFVHVVRTRSDCP